MRMTDRNARRNAATNTLRTVAPDKAFSFYREVGQPLGLASRSLDELATAVEGVDPSSVRFHIERGDFENWLRMLGDRPLADQVASLRGQHISPDELRRLLSSMIRTRIDRLHKIAGSK